MFNQNENILDAQYYRTSKEKSNQEIFSLPKKNIDESLAFLVSGLCEYFKMRNSAPFQFLQYQDGDVVNTVICPKKPIIETNDKNPNSKNNEIKEIEKGVQYLLNPNTPWKNMTSDVKCAAYEAIIAALKLAELNEGFQLLLPPNLRIRLGLNYLERIYFNEKSEELKVPFLAQVWRPPLELGKNPIVEFSTKRFGSTKWYTHELFIYKK